MSGEIRKAINKRYKLFIKARKTPRNSTDWSEYKRARNTRSKLIQNAKANFWKTEFQSSSSPKTFWSTVRKYKGVTKSQRIGPLEDVNKVILNDLERSSVMNSFVATIGKKLSSNKADQNDNSRYYRVTSVLQITTLNPERLKKSFKAAVKKGKACGPDGITSNDLTHHEDVSINGLHKVIKRSLLSGKFPTEWKNSRVTAVHKKGSKKSCSNYRPISLLSIPREVVEHLICSQINDHLTTFNLQNEHQWGFRNKRSTEDVLLYMTEK